mmetsp:Transcript_23601/g.58512  ORF Transcript_23601/g.58512 Transcript_23601/m.58512 type:complete len:205 (-) Transcript_23601:2336-2950(-)
MGPLCPPATAWPTFSSSARCALSSGSRLLTSMLSAMAYAFLMASSSRATTPVSSRTFRSLPYSSSKSLSFCSDWSFSVLTVLSCSSVSVRLSVTVSTSTRSIVICFSNFSTRAMRSSSESLRAWATVEDAWRSAFCSIAFDAAAAWSSSRPCFCRSASNFDSKSARIAFICASNSDPLTADASSSVRSTDICVACVVRSTCTST